MDQRNRERRSFSHQQQQQHQRLQQYEEQIQNDFLNDDKFKKRSQLMRRIYDQGIQNPMPSVKKERENMLEQPLLAKVTIDNWKKIALQQEQQQLMQQQMEQQQQYNQNQQQQQQESGNGTQLDLSSRQQQHYLPQGNKLPHIHKSQYHSNMNRSTSQHNRGSSSQDGINISNNNITGHLDEHLQQDEDIIFRPLPVSKPISKEFRMQAFGPSKSRIISSNNSSKPQAALDDNSFNLMLPQSRQQMTRNINRKVLEKLDISGIHQSGNNKDLLDYTLLQILQNQQPQTGPEKMNQTAFTDSRPVVQLMDKMSGKLHMLNLQRQQRELQRRQSKRGKSAVAINNTNTQIIVPTGANNNNSTTLDQQQQYLNATSSNMLNLGDSAANISNEQQQQARMVAKRQSVNQTGRQSNQAGSLAADHIFGNQEEEQQTPAEEEGAVDGGGSQNRQMQFVISEDGEQVPVGNQRSNSLAMDGKARMSDIDTFIQMVREHKLSPMEFIYLKKRTPNSNDAYNMCVVSYQDLIDEGLVNYYTLSSKGVTRYENKMPIEFVHLGDWLKEREQFNSIKNLSFFRKFRKWKTLKKWCKILFLQRSKQLQEVLNDKLFILHPEYSKMLLEHRKMCQDMEKMRFVDLNENLDTLSLEQFADVQENLRQEIVKKLSEYSKNLHDNCRLGIKRVIEKLRTDITSEMSQEEEQQMQQQQMLQQQAQQQQQQGNGLQHQQGLDEKKQIMEMLGFPPNMSYGHRSKMRYEFMRFLRLAYLLDFVAVHSLGNIYINSAVDFLARIQKVADSCFEGEVLQQTEPVQQEIDPMFTVEIACVLQQPRKALEVVEGEMPWLEIKNKPGELFDLQMNLEIMPKVSAEEKEAAASQSPTKPQASTQGKAGQQSQTQQQQKKKTVVHLEEDDFDDEEVRKVRHVRNLHQSWLEFMPNKQKFLSTMQTIFSEGQDCIQVIERWSKHVQFEPYVKGLEEWDEIIGEKWSKPDSYYLNPSNWLKEHPIYQQFMKQLIGIFESSFQRLEQFQAEYGPFLNLVWRAMNSDMSQLREPRLRARLRIFTLALNGLQTATKTLEEKLIGQTKLGLFLVNAGSVSKELLPVQKNLVKKLEGTLLDIFRQRGTDDRDWLTKSIKSLTGMVLKIEEFVEQKNSLDKIYEDLPARRESLSVLHGMYNALAESKVEEIKKDDTELAVVLNSLESSINVAINEAETSTAKNIDRFKKSLKEYTEKLKEESQQLMESARKEKFLHVVTKLDDALRELGEIDNKMKEAEANMKRYSEYEEILQVQEAATYNTLLDAREELNLRLYMWRGIQEFRTLSATWSRLPFHEVNAKEIAAKTDFYYRTVQKCRKNLPENKVLAQLADPVIAFRNTMPVVTALRSPYLTEEHWAEVKAILKSEFSLQIGDNSFTLAKLLDLHVGDYQEELMDIAVRAAQEDSIKQQLTVLEEQWAEVTLTMKPYRDAHDVQVLAEVDELCQKFDEGLATMNNLLASRFVRPLRGRAEKIQSELMLLQDIIDRWVECQKKWMYLENIFSAPDIKRNLPNESHQFELCDKFLKSLFKKSASQPKINKLLKWPNLLDHLVKTSEQLDIIERQLENFLDQKRQAFPRFYFISNDELLEILAKASKLEAVEPNIGKCFEGLVRLWMKDKTTSTSILIYGMGSPEGEIVPFLKPITAKGQIEMWLDQMQREMFESMHKLVKTGLQDYMNGVQKTRSEWIAQHKGQVVATVSQILWCINTEDAINQVGSGAAPNALYEWHDTSVVQLSQLTALVRGELSSLARRIIVALITTDVHNRDIVEKLAQNEVESPQDFLWNQQLRYYWEEDSDNCVIKQVTAKMVYGYEYLGATSRLVITPLTDRCWITITSALANQLGAAPAGPAGTGKTESTKDLAKALGRLCIVFNCSDQISAQMMNKLFSGLVQQGAWSCLDEFNRIDIEVLSVIAQQVLTIRMALLVRAERFEFEGIEIPLKSTCGVFVTMNPGYAGRTELPDNLKSLFRPVSMMIPDYAMIAEIMLFAEGFEAAPTLSKKMVQLYKLSSEQLSQQDHYDFGMRALKSLLVMAGQLKRAEQKLSEDLVLIRAMRDANIPKFLKDDIPLFNALVQDLFPGAQLPEVPAGALEFAAQVAIRNAGLQVVQSFVLKISQLFDTLNVRFGVMLVGPSGSGKTECYRTLARTLTALRAQDREREQLQQQQQQPSSIPSDPRYQSVDYHILNPKSVSMGELYGEVDPFTQEWVDGLASSIIRTVNTVQLDETWDPKKKEWIVFDGPVDALWIENMNTVLDDNMTLCLANSERIKLRQELRMLFEVQDLAVASPATVSRCGMVYLCHEDLGWQPYVQSWMQRRFTNVKPVAMSTQQQQQEENPNQAQNQQSLSSATPNSKQIYLDPLAREGLMNLFSNTFDAATEQMKGFYQPFPCIKIQQATNVCNFLETLMIKLPTQGEALDETMKKLNYMFAFSFIWGVGGSMDQQHYDRMDKIFKDSVFPNLRFPKGETIFDFFLDNESQKCFLDWESRLEPFKFDREMPYFELLVPTIDTTKYSHVLENLIACQKPCLITGQTGVGKSVIVQNLLRLMKTERATFSVFLNFSAQTNAKQTQLAIEAKLQKKGKTLFGARPNERIAVFIDDVNMPALDLFGAQPCIELLRQLVDKGGLYDRAKLFWKNIEDTTLICAGAPPGGGRNALTPRFVRHFNVLCLPQPSDSALNKIFGSIIKEFLNAFNFSDAMRRTHDACVASTIDVYNTISKELLPIPSKFHYTFNLRDISKVFQGLLMVRPQSVNSPEGLARVWLHESCRVFGDRLVSAEDWTWFQQLTISILTRRFGFSWTSEDLFSEGQTIVFSDVLRLDVGSTVLYEDITNERKKIVKTLEEKQEDYKIATNDKMDLVFFEMACAHILHLCRILRQPRGNAMLIGVGGSGKQSVSKLAAFIMKCEIFQIELLKNYNTQAFREDLAKIFRRSGVDHVPLCFIFTDVQIAYESFLEDINNLLNTGEVPNLYAKKEDIDLIISDARAYAQKNKHAVADAPEALWNYFVESVRANLHTILCMSPVGEALRVRCRKFPSLVNCCTLDWFSAWPAEALLSVAHRFLDAVDLPGESTRDALTQLCMTVAVDVASSCEKFHKELKRRVYTTPKSYLDQIALYVKLLDKKRNEIGSVKRKLSEGLQKLYSTNQIVSQLKKEMEDLQPRLEEQSVKTDIFLKQLAIDSEQANEVEHVVQEETNRVNDQAQEVKVIAAEAQAELDLALPQLQEAQDALNTINKADIAQIKGYNNPPPAVGIVLEAVCILLQEKTDWQSAKQVMVDMNFIDRLRSFDKNAVTDQTLKKLRQVVNKPQFDPISVGQSSMACRSLCLWCRAIDNYSKVYKVVEPKKAKVASLQAQLDQKNKELKVKTDELTRVKDKVAKLQKECDETIAFKNKLEADIAKTKGRLIAAEKLTELLADEGVRWSQQIKIIDVSIAELIGSVFLAASVISYCGAFSIPYREALIRQWVDAIKEAQVPIAEQYAICDTLETPIHVRDWILQGLPNDAFSIENAVIAVQCDRWPLLIDPQGEANKWLKAHFRQMDLKVLRFSETHYLKALQSAISSGFPVLIEDVTERLEPSVDSVLQKQIFNVDGRRLIRVGDKRVDYHNAFRLFLTTKMANPHYLPEVFIKVTVINFSIAFEGLQNQLISDVMKAERPEIERQRDEIIVSIATDKKSLKEAQDKILELLAEAKGMILDDQELIKTLEESKFKSAEIQKSLEEATLIEQEINDNRSVYNKVAVRGTVLYFVVQDLAGIDPMYQYSLTYFKKLFRQAIAITPQSTIIEERLILLNETITKQVFQNVCRGLFESHKKLFSFLICTSIKRQSREISINAWNLLIRGPGLPNKDPAAKEVKDPVSKDAKEPQHKDATKEPITSKEQFREKQLQQQQLLAQQANDPYLQLKEAFPEQCWNLLQSCASQIQELAHLPQSIKMNPTAWMEFAKSDDIYHAPFPKGFMNPPSTHQIKDSFLDSGSYFNPFYRLLLIKAFRPEKIMHSFSHYVTQELGKQYESTSAGSMDEVYADSDVNTPIIFILSQGADPTQMLLKFSKEKGYQIQVISLGQGQGAKAEALIEKSRKVGGWVLLQNCHLAKSWMNSLEKIVEIFQSSPAQQQQQENTGSTTQNNSDFRLFLTSMPAEYFPVSVLQNGLKLTTEAPRGLKANIKRSYQEFSQSFLDSCQHKKDKWLTLLFGLTFFHAIVQERRKFGPLGFNIRYEFNDSDLDISTLTLRMFVNDQNENLPWDAMIYMTGHINYGGRVTDDWDRVCLLSILKKYYCLEILQDDYKFSSSGLYFAPQQPQPETISVPNSGEQIENASKQLSSHQIPQFPSDIEVYRQYIENLPTFDDPEVFGMSENANIIFQNQESNKMIDTILSIQPRVTQQSEGKSSDEIVMDMAKELLAILPDLLLRETGNPNLFVTNEVGSYASLTTVLLQEVEKFNKLLKVCKASLENLQKAIKGFVVMSQDLDDMYLCFLNNQLPPIWKKVSYASLKPLSSWFKDLIQRVQMMRTWLQNDNPNTFWLSGFYFPQGFLTGVLQTHSRKYKIPIDTLSFKFKVMDIEADKISCQPKDGVYIHGLFLDQGKWDGGRETLVDQELGQLYFPLPVIQFSPTENYTIPEDYYSCPCYKTSNRVGVLSTTGQSTNFILAVGLTTKHEKPEYWTLRGTALLCQLDD